MRSRRGVLLGLLVVAVLAASAPALLVAGQLSTSVALDEPETGVFAVHVDGPASVDDARLLLDGEDVTDGALGEGGVVRLEPGDLADGEYVLRVEVPRRFPLRPVTAERTLTVDTTPPALEILEPRGPVVPAQPVTLRARSEPGAQFTVDGEPVAAAGGELAVTLPQPATRGSVRVAAADDAGNVAEADVPITLDLPGIEGGAPMRGVHMSGHSWAGPALRDPVLAMIDEGRINTVQLDLKDESGAVSYASSVPLALQAGAVRPQYDLAEAVRDLHGRGVRVVGRIVAFADPVLARWAADSGRLDLVVQHADGSPYTKYGGYTNFAHPVVQQYHVDLAEEAARAGVDDILYDYVRRPDGPITGMRFPGIEGSPEDQIIAFLAESRRRLEPTGARLGASVFGVSLTSPRSVAQDIPRMAEHVHYIAPMVYPSHWGPGEYGVANPNAQPYDITFRSLDAFRRVLDGTPASVVGWLQDFSLGVPYGPDEVRAQIRAAADAGVDDWLLWNAGVRYTAAGIDPP